MPAFDFIGASYEARSKNFDAQRCVNLYPEVSGSGDSKSVAMLIGTPGLALYKVLSGGNVRGLLRFKTTLAVAVVGTRVYVMNSDTNLDTFIGSIAANVNPVSMASNGALVMLVTGAPNEGYFIDPVALTLTKIGDADFAGGDKVGFLAGRFVWNKPGTGQFQYTEVYDNNIDGLNFETAEASPDNIVSLICGFSELWTFGEVSTEVFQPSGDPDIPFAKVQGTTLEIGCQAKNSVGEIDNSFFWLGGNDSGDGIVWRAIGYQPQRISTHALEFAIASYSRTDDAVGWTYQQEGHSFYMLNFPTANKTWCYDIATGKWHERAWRNPADGSLNRHRGQCQMQFAGRTVVGDWQTNSLYALDLDTYTDDTLPIPRIRACAHLAAQDLKLQYFHSLQIDMETGVGTVGQQFADPQAMLRWSDDGGHTWSSEHWAAMGKVGEYRRRARWRRMGRSRDRVFELTITDPVKVILISAMADVEVGAS